MKLKKWLALFVGVCALCTVLFAAFNVLVDPFGVFGDPIMDWYEYNMTENPRVAKVAYLQRRHEEYDSYILGSSKVSSISGERLEEYLGGSFYNLTWYGGNLGDEVNAANYLLDNYQVNNLVLMIEPMDALAGANTSTDLKERMHCAADGSSALSFYLSYLFCNPTYAMDKLSAWQQRGYLVNSDAVYLAETGSYNKQLRDLDPVSGLDEFLAREASHFLPTDGVMELPYVERAISLIRQLKERCEEQGVNLIVLSAPQYQDDFLSFDREDVAALWRGVAQVTDFWDFSGLNSINVDARYFYDRQHFRNAVGEMALARIFGDESVYVPEDFGVLVTADNVEERLTELWTASATAEENSTAVPVLLYHSLTEDPAQVNDMTMTTETFRAHMEALAQAGFETVTMEDLVSYVQQGTPLPEKPVIITFDDGYANNLTLGAPILEEYGFTAGIAVIGVSAGKSVYKDTGAAMIPHFSMEEARAWIQAGVIQLSSHSYDMHQVTTLDGQDCRSGVLPLPDEEEEAYIQALREDYAASLEVLKQAGQEGGLQVFAYPYGQYTSLSEVILKEMGVSVTLGLGTQPAQVVRGLPQSLRVISRITITEEYTPQQLLELVQP